jgi:predicted MPP superfamily phosphohydrolase
MSGAGFLVFAVFMVAVLSALNAHVFRWARNAFALGERPRRILRWILIASIAAVVLGRLAGRFWPSATVSGVIAVGSTVQLAVIISGILLLVADAVLGVDSLVRRVAQALRAAPAPALSSTGESITPTPPPESPRPELPRRVFLTQAAASSAFLIGGSSSLYGALKGRHDYAIEEVAIRLPGLARSFDGFSIAQLSDVHIGAFTGDAELAIAEELLRKARADLIVLTGDLLDNDPKLAPQLGRFVRRVAPLARHGVVAIAGNHDFFAGVEEMASAVRRGGGRMLRNEALVLGEAGAGVALLGVDDVWARRVGSGPDLARAVRELPRLGGKIAPALDLPRVLLCHNPSFFDDAAGQVGLQLSGHTHGGQVNLGVRPADYLLPGGWVAGRYELNGSQLYVNRGFGTVGPPARVGAPPEVTRVVLSA